MRISCLQENLRRGLAIVGRAVATRSTLPVLSHVLLATDGSHLTLAATNLEIAVTCRLGAMVLEEGAITAPARLLSELVAGLPNDTIDIHVDARAQTLHLGCGRTRLSVKGLAAEEFPTIPSSAGIPVATFPSELLHEVIEQVAFAATDDTRPVLAGVLINLAGNSATFTAIDNFRLSRRSIKLVTAVDGQHAVIVPARALLELACVTGGERVEIAISLTPSGGQILFQTEQMQLLARLIDGRFPEIERVIPKASATRAIFETRELAKAVKLASLFATSAANIIRLDLEPGAAAEPGSLSVGAQATELGEHQSIPDGIVDGPGGHMALNVNYLADALSAITTPQVALEMEGALRPAVFKPVGAEGFVLVIMPMNLP